MPPKGKDQAAENTFTSMMDRAKKAKVTDNTQLAPQAKRKAQPRAKKADTTDLAPPEASDDDNDYTAPNSPTVTQSPDFQTKPPAAATKNSKQESKQKKKPDFRKNKKTLANLISAASARSPPKAQAPKVRARKTPPAAQLLAHQRAPEDSKEALRFKEQVLRANNVECFVGTKCFSIDASAIIESASFFGNYCDYQLPKDHAIDLPKENDKEWFIILPWFLGVASTLEAEESADADKVFQEALTNYKLAESHGLPLYKETFSLTLKRLVADRDNANFLLDWYQAADATLARFVVLQEMLLRNTVDASDDGPSSFYDAIKTDPRLAEDYARLCTRIITAGTHSERGLAVSGEKFWTKSSISAGAEHETAPAGDDEVDNDVEMAV